MMYTATIHSRQEGALGEFSPRVVVFDQPGPDESLTQAAIRAARLNGFETHHVVRITPIVPDQPRARP